MSSLFLEFGRRYEVAYLKRWIPDELPDTALSSRDNVNSRKGEETQSFSQCSLRILAA